jgi:Rps23 Pro-64 3,4-dihydroxylase Tpa1-like proline 4-hydroxylase
MAEVTSGENLTVLILNEVEAEALAALVVDYIEFHEDNIRENGADDPASVLLELYEALR